jgi:hypothetical protein
MPILRKRRVSRGLAAEEGQGAKSSMHRKQGSGAQFSVQSLIQQRSRLSIFQQLLYLFKGHGRKIIHVGGQYSPLMLQPVDSGQHSSTIKKVHGNANRITVFRWLEE